MRKGQGRSQQIRGHRRRTKVLNRRLGRNPSDIDTADYINHVQNFEEVKQEIYNEEKEKENA